MLLYILYHFLNGFFNNVYQLRIKIIYFPGSTIFYIGLYSFLRVKSCFAHAGQHVYDDFIKIKCFRSYLNNMRNINS